MSDDGARIFTRKELAHLGKAAEELTAILRFLDGLKNAPSELQIIYRLDSFEWEVPHDIVLAIAKPAAEYRRAVLIERLARYGIRLAEDGR